MPCHDYYSVPRLLYDPTTTTILCHDYYTMLRLLHDFYTMLWLLYYATTTTLGYDLYTMPRLLYCATTTIRHLSISQYLAHTMLSTHKYSIVLIWKIEPDFNTDEIKQRKFDIREGHMKASTNSLFLAQIRSPWVAMGWYSRTRETRAPRRFLDTSCTSGIPYNNFKRSQMQTTHPL